MSNPRRPPANGTRRTNRGPSEIAPGIFVGGWKDAEAFQGARFCVLDELPEEKVPADRHVPIYDERSDAPIRKNLDELADLVRTAHEGGRPVLMFCGHGVRRGSLAGAWYLHRVQGIPLDAAYERVRAARPQIEHVKEWVGNWQSLEEPGRRPAASARRA
jgi:protein-tyrosine phosphatase